MTFPQNLKKMHSAEGGHEGTSQPGEDAAERGLGTLAPVSLSSGMELENQ